VTVPALTTGPAIRLGIVHSTGFRYAGPVVTSYNEARMTPLTTPTQTTLEARLEVTPHAGTYRYWDYWGTQVTAFDVRAPHEQMTVTARSVVETFAAPPTTTEVGWDELRRPAGLDQHAELLATTPRTVLGGDALALATEVAAGLAPAGAAAAVCRLVCDRLDYVPGATRVTTSGQEAWDVGQGVCQDMAHVAVGMLRALGVPARYASGYLLPRADLAVGESVDGESHAWVEWWAGEWQAWDPTNGRPAGVDHVLVGRGRDYDDVPPLRGVYSGPGGGELFVSVSFDRLA
jgi:transglutaminase-like putative cysteine protease